MVNPLRLDTTYEELMEFKLLNTSDDLDKREVTSLLYNAFANNSYETVQMLFTIANAQNMLLADTAPREILIRIAAEKDPNLKPFPATPAIRKGVFNIDVPIGSRFSIEDVNYTVISKISPSVMGEFNLEAETPGVIGNAYYGTLIPIDYVLGLNSAQLTDILIPGEEEESTESFRERYLNSYDSSSFGGNRAYYKEHVNALNGVGGTKVFRAWNGGGTVKLVIVDSQFKAPSSTLVTQVQQDVDPPGLQGEGVGIAPIDHIVTVVGATETTIDIAFTIEYTSGWSWNDIELQVQNMVDNYFIELGEIFAKSVTYEEDNSGVIVRISQLENRLLDIGGVVDVTATLLNGAASNITLAADAIPKRGTVSG